MYITGQSQRADIQIMNHIAFPSMQEMDMNVSMERQHYVGAVNYFIMDGEVICATSSESQRNILLFYLRLIKLKYVVQLIGRRCRTWYDAIKRQLPASLHDDFCDWVVMHFQWIKIFVIILFSLWFCHNSSWKGIRANRFSNDVDPKAFALRDMSAHVS